MIWLFTSGSQNIGASALASALPMNIQGWFPLGLTGLLSLMSKGLTSLLQHYSLKASVLWHSAFFMIQLSYPYMTTGKTIALTRRTFVSKVTSLLLNMLSTLLIAFLPRSKCLLITWLQSPSAMILEPPKMKSATVSTVCPSVCQEVVLEKAEEPEIKLPTSVGSWKKQESSRKTSISALLTMPKPLIVWITRNCGKFWKRWEYQTTWPASWETCMQVRKQQLELDIEQKTGSK